MSTKTDAGLETLRDKIRETQGKNQTRLREFSDDISDFIYSVSFLTCVRNNVAITAGVFLDAKPGQTQALGDLNWVDGLPHIGYVIGGIAVCKIAKRKVHLREL